MRAFPKGKAGQMFTNDLWVRLGYVPRLNMQLHNKLVYNTNLVWSKVWSRKKLGTEHEKQITAKKKKKLTITCGQSTNTVFFYLIPDCGSVALNLWSFKASTKANHNTFPCCDSATAAREGSTDASHSSQDYGRVRQKDLIALGKRTRK